uniref:Uncharacterized protein n=1 Tax=Scytodes thoracica TaxID=1112478 RepID=A0A0A0V7B6_SCYTH|nr:hypothetical protein [Scytodes thoracica]
MNVACWTTAWFAFSLMFLAQAKNTYSKLPEKVKREAEIYRKSAELDSSDRGNGAQSVERDQCDCEHVCADVAEEYKKVIVELVWDIDESGEEDDESDESGSKKESGAKEEKRSSPNADAATRILAAVEKVSSRENAKRSILEPLVREIKAISSSEESSSEEKTHRRRRRALRSQSTNDQN